MTTEFIRADDVAACLSILRRGSKSFSAASRLLPSRLRAPSAVVYAFCRVVDDLVDHAVDRAGQDRALLEVSARIEGIYAHRVHTDPVDRAFSAVSKEFRIPKDVLLWLVEGFRWDVEGRTYETPHDLAAYGVRVASTVGVMMTCLMGGRSYAVLSRAADLGIAMQWTNIARDVGEDARQGRLYLPRHWMNEVGLDPDCWMKEPVFSPALGRVVSRLLDNADVYYERADAGIAALPLDCRPAIAAARYLYAEIGQRIRIYGCDTVTSRASTRKRDKARVLLTDVPRGIFLNRRAGLDASCDPAAEPLIRAVAQDT